MALAPRRRRRRPRWLLVGVLATLAVLVVSAAFSASPESPSRRLAQLAYLDRVRPEVERSTAQGGALAELRSDPATVGRPGAARRIARVAGEAEDVHRAVRGTAPPPSLSTPHSILVATMAIRARAVAAVARALKALTADGPDGPVVDALTKAGDELLAAERTYRVFLDALPPPETVGATGPLMPASVWLDEPGLWTRPELAAFVTSVRSTASRSPVHDVRVLVVTTEPAAVGTEGSALVLPTVRTLRLEIVVANTGNEAERAVPVVATLVGPAGEVDTARDFVDLAPGQRRTLTLGGLRPVPGGTSTLTVVVGPVEGEASSPDNERSLALVLRG